MPARRRIACIMLASFALSGCVTFYQKDREWGLPGGLLNFSIRAHLGVGPFYREASIFVNGEEVLSGRSWFWSDIIEMTGAFQGIPLGATCDTETKICDLVVAGVALPPLKVN